MLENKYVAPLCESIEIANEGLLCTSPVFGIDDWVEDANPLN